MNKNGYTLLLALLAAACLVPGSAAGEPSLEYSLNESHSEIYERMLEQNASLGEYYEQVCPEFLEDMPPEVRAHIYNMSMSRHLDCDNGTFVPPGKQVAIGIASPGDSGKGWHVALYSIGILALFGIGILALLAVAWLVLKRVRDMKE